MMKRRLFLSLVVLSVLAALYGAYHVQFVYLGNVHVVSEGRAYRSGQLGPERLAEIIARHGIRSVLNLRGETPGEAWYDDEVRVCAERDVAHYSVGIRARFEPPPEKVDEILRVLQDAPKPILIHCMAGADRAGLVSAMWKLAIEGTSREEAARQLSVRYGHLPFGQARPMDTFFERWSRSWASADHEPDPL